MDRLFFDSLRDRIGVSVPTNTWCAQWRDKHEEGQVEENLLTAEMLGSIELLDLVKE